MSFPLAWWVPGAVALAIWCIGCFVWAGYKAAAEARRARNRNYLTGMYELEDLRAQVFSLRIRNRRLQNLVRSHRARDDVRKMINNLERAAARHNQP